MVQFLVLNAIGLFLFPRTTVMVYIWYYLLEKDMLSQLNTIPN